MTDKVLETGNGWRLALLIKKKRILSQNSVWFFSFLLYFCLIPSFSRIINFGDAECKNFEMEHYVQTFHPISLVSVILAGTIDLYHDMPLSVALTLAEGQCQQLFCWLLNVPATCECISGTDLLRQFYVLPHWDRSCRSNFPSYPVTVYWHWANLVPALTL